MIGASLTSSEFSGGLKESHLINSFMIRWFTFPDLIKQLAFGVHLPVMGFDKSSNEYEGKEIIVPYF